MFFFRHPRPVWDTRPVAVQVAQQKARTDVNTLVLEVKDAREGAKGGAVPDPESGDGAAK
ncbi:hypothetical protein GCM10027318_16360 [Massilia agilis]